MKHYEDEHISRNVELTDWRIPIGISVGVAHWKTNRNDIASVFKTRLAGMDLQVDITPSQARELSALLLTHADEVEEREIEVRAA